MCASRDRRRAGTSIGLRICRPSETTLPPYIEGGPFQYVSPFVLWSFDAFVAASAGVYRFEILLDDRRLARTVRLPIVLSPAFGATAH